MSFIENFKERFTDAANATGKKANEVYEVTKIKIALAEAQSDLRALFVQLGKLTYDAYVSGEDVEEKAHELFKNIEKLEGEIEELKGKQNQIKKVKICDKCGAEIAADANFCAKCGNECDFEAEVVE